VVCEGQEVLDAAAVSLPRLGPSRLRSPLTLLSHDVFSMRD